jgi:hypothetical protein
LQYRAKNNCIFYMETAVNCKPIGEDTRTGYFRVVLSGNFHLCRAMTRCAPSVVTARAGRLGNLLLPPSRKARPAIWHVQHVEPCHCFGQLAGD